MIRRSLMGLAAAAMLVAAVPAMADYTQDVPLGEDVGPDNSRVIACHATGLTIRTGVGDDSVSIRLAQGDDFYGLVRGGVPWLRGVITLEEYTKLNPGCIGTFLFHTGVHGKEGDEK